MNNTQDLHLEKEILPLFDYTLNKFSKKVLLDVLEKPLLNENEIMLRQKVLKGFLDNYEILKNYSYLVSDLLGVYNFLGYFKIGDLKKRSFKYRLFASKYQKAQDKSNFIQI